MILYLFGGYSIQNGEVQWRLMEKELNDLSPSQVLYLGFAHSGKSGALSFFMKEKLSNLLGEKFLDAARENDLDKAVKPLIFIDGGHAHLALKEAVFKNQRLKHLIYNADYIFAESAGSMFLGSKTRLSSAGSEAIDGLGILKGVVIEPHYSQRQREKLLKKEMEDWGCTIGVGIDEASALKIDPRTFPENYEVLDGLVEVFLKNPEDRFFDEMLDLVDREDNVIGSVRRSEAHRDLNLIHREVGVFIHDGKKRVLLQKRSANKEVAPGVWTTGAGGHVPKGVSPHAAVHHELKEELRFDADLRPVEKTFVSTDGQSIFSYRFLGEVAGLEVVPNPEEVEAARFFTKAEFDQLIKQGEKIYPRSENFVQRFWAGKFNQLL